MKCYLVYDFPYQRIEFWEVPDGECLDDVAGKYFIMDNQESGILSCHTSFTEAKAVAKERFQADIKKLNERLITLETQKPNKPHGGYPEE